MDLEMEFIPCNEKVLLFAESETLSDRCDETGGCRDKFWVRKKRASISGQGDDEEGTREGQLNTIHV